MEAVYKLISEGPDDRNVLYHLLNKHRIPLAPVEGGIVLEEKGGIDNVLKYLRAQLKLIDEDVAVARIGIVVDADEQIEARWQALCDILRNAGYSAIPKTPDPQGTIILDEDRIGIGI